MIKLYHFTIDKYVASIKEHGIMPMGEKQRRGMYPASFDPPPPMFPLENELVWLTRSAEAYAGIQDPWEGEPVRIEVAVSDAKAWRVIAPKYQVPPVWIKTLREAAQRMGANNFDRDWYVIEGIIPPERIVEVVSL